jgi:hypothetical protein
VIDRASFKGSTLPVARAGKLVEAAYLDLCHAVHHYELDEIDSTIVLDITENWIDLPVDCHIAVLLTIGDASTGAFIAALLPDRFQQVYYKQETVAGAPAIRGRFGSQLFFDRIPDAAYKSILYYYKNPTAPDFATGNSALDRAWDEHIVEGAVAKATGAIWDLEKSTHQGEALSEWVQRAPEILLRDLPIHDKQSAEGGHDQIGGPKG